MDYLSKIYLSTTNEIKRNTLKRSHKQNENVKIYFIRLTFSRKDEVICVKKTTEQKANNLP